MTDRHGSLSFSRWWLIASGTLAMGIAGTFQFVWSSIRGPLGSQIGATEATLGTLFTIVIATQTIAQFPAGWFRDRYGPTLPTLAGGVLIAAGYGGLATAATPIDAGIAAAAGGAGAGAIYTIAVNTPIKWFDERRGLATGVLTMSYALLSFALIPVVRRDLLGGLEVTLVAFGVVAVLVCLLAAAVLRDPKDGPEAAEPQVTDGGESEAGSAEPYQWRQAIRTRQFWVLYAVFIVVNGVGLMLIGKLITVAETIGLSAATATAGASIVAVADGAGGLIVGGLSDRFGPLRTVGAALLVSAAGIAGAVVDGTQGVGALFVAAVAVAGFFRSPVFAIFPAVVGEFYGRSYSSENYAVLYTAKLWGSVFAGTVASVLIATIGWSESFLLGAGLLGLAGLVVFTIEPVDRADAEHPP
jgi:OFA family oxalate/formate antiporter-like MFS transporter